MHLFENNMIEAVALWTKCMICISTSYDAKYNEMEGNKQSERKRSMWLFESRTIRKTNSFMCYIWNHESVK